MNLTPEAAERIHAEVASFREEYDLLTRQPSCDQVLPAFSRIELADRLGVDTVQEVVSSLTKAARESSSVSEAFLLEDFASVLSRMIDPLGGAR